MALFVIGDLHLSLGADKPMDVFGPAWRDHARRLRENWRSLVAPEDTVVLCGDLSWGTALEEALPDFRFVDELPGRKLLLKGNHDYYWDTLRKMRAFLAANGLRTIDFLHNNCWFCEGVALCGTKGWFEEEGAETHDRKIYLREIIRLRASLSEARAKGCAHPLAFLHYPPVTPVSEYREITDELRAFGVEHCFYGHLHGAGLAAAVNGVVNGVRYHCVSADHVKFTPQKVL